MIRIYQSSSNRSRLNAAVRFVENRTAGSEVLILGATREAADDFVREAAVRGRATFGLHSFSLMQLVSSLSMGELAARGIAPASALATEAVAARATFEGLSREQLTALAPVADFPGFARALARTVGELRQAGIGQDEIRRLSGEQASAPDLALLLDLFGKELDRAGVADRCALLEIAARELGQPRHQRWRGMPILLLDVPVTNRSEREFLRALMESSPEAFVTVSEGDSETLRQLRHITRQEAPSTDGDGTIGDDSGHDDPGTAGDDDLGHEQDSLRRLHRYLFSEERPPVRFEADEQVRLLSAPGESREAVEIVRQVLDESRRGIRLDEMAVFVRSPELYSPHLETAFRRAEIPAFFARGTKRPDPSGRAFLALLACKSERLSAKRFAEYLSFSQVPNLDDSGAPLIDRGTWVGPEDESFGPAPRAVARMAATIAPSGPQLALVFPETLEAPAPSTTGSPLEILQASGETDTPVDGDHLPAIEGTLRAPWKWEEYLVEAAVIGGRDRWARRLRGLENELRLTLEEIRSEEPESPRIPAKERDLVNLGHLERFALPVIETLGELPEAATWGQWIDALTELAPRVLRQPDRVLAVLAEMQPMAEIGPVAIEEVRGVLMERLSNLEREPRESRFGRVFVATPEQARARSFRVVFIPGLAERLFPQRPREDPLLSDLSRQSLGGGLRRQEDRAATERQALRLAIGAAEERVVLSWPRVDVVQARPRVPSFYALDVARATHGAIPDYEDLEREATALADARLAWPSPSDPARAIDAVEHDLAVLGPLLQSSQPENAKGRARYLLELNDHLARSLRSRWVRWRQKAWLPQDGIVRSTRGISEALARNRPHQRPYSVTALQKFAACPYQFFLSAILRLEPRADVVALVQLDPLTKGSLVHQVQAEVLRELKRTGALPVTVESLDDATQVLDSTLDRVAGVYQEEVAPAIERVWLDEIETIRADLRVWIKRRVEQDAEWVPRYFEYAFGLPSGPDFDPESAREPAVLEGGWKLRGAIDLIEASPDGSRLRVTDHKTGANRTKEGWIVGGGETLQPVLYSLVVERILGLEVPEGRLSFCTTKGGFSECVVALNDWSRLYARQVLEAVDQSVSEGLLPPAPRKDACRFCDFRPVCGPYEETRSIRKDRKPLKPLDDLRQLP